MAGCLPLDPVLLPAARPVRAAARGQRAVQRLIVHPAQHQHLAGVVLLRDRGKQACCITLQPGRHPGIEATACRPWHSPPRAIAVPLCVHDSPSSVLPAPFSRTGYPAARSDSLTSPIPRSPEWNMLSARTASAPPPTAAT